MKPSVVFTSSFCLFATQVYGQNNLQVKAEAIFERSCGTCHVEGKHDIVFVNKKGDVQWDNIEKYAPKIIEAVEAKKMPPARAPGFAKISDQQRENLLSYVRTLLPETDTTILNLAKLQLPPDLKVSVLAKVPSARTMAVHSSGIIFVGTGAPTPNAAVNDSVYAVIPGEDDHVSVIKFMTGLDAPNGVALDGDDLYVAEATRIIKFKDAAQMAMDKAKSPSLALSYEVIKDDFAKQETHYWKYLAIGPDHKLYVPLGANCNVCLEDDRESVAGIFRMNLDGTGYEQIAKGIRNTVGFDWDPATGDLWFTDNGRDLLGDDMPSDELNHLTTAGQDFGFPYCFAADVSDPEFGSLVDCKSPTFIKPVVELGAHVAALGMTFYRGDLLPEAYKGNIFIAEHGSWNRTSKVGYRIRVVQKAESGQQSFTDNQFIGGWLDEETQENWGRPVDVKNYIDGSLLISDDYAGVIYQVTPAKAK